MLAIIVAKTKNNVIGTNNTLPWKQRNDLQRFKSLTVGHDIILGRKTFDSFNGRILPDRHHWIVTRDDEAFLKSISGLPKEELVRVSVMRKFDKFVASPDDAKNCGAFVIGGEQIYRQLMPLATHMYITELDVELEGDAFFPEISLAEWKLVAQESYKADDKNQYDYKFLTYKRI